jgi:molybdopterin converting factor small subunit
MSEPITISILFFGAARDVVDKNPLSLYFDGAPTVSQVFQQLVERYRGLGRFGRSLLFAVNQEYATPETVLHDNDELAIFPPVSGGSGEYRHDFFELTVEPIDVGSVARRVVLPECGERSIWFTKRTTRWLCQSCTVSVLKRTTVSTLRISGSYIAQADWRSAKRA